MTTTTDTPTAVFTATFADFTEVLKTVAPVIPKRPHVPAVSGVLLEADGTDMVVTGNNFHTSITTRVPDAAATPGRCLVPHAEVTKILKALVKGMCKHDAARTPVTLRAHGVDGPVSVEVGESSIPVEPLPLAEYPERPDVPAPWVELPTEEFVLEARRVLRACGRDETLPLTCGVKIEPAPDGGVGLAATDRYRLAVGHVSARSTLEVPSSEGTQVNGLVLEDVLPMLSGQTLTLGTGPDLFGDVVAFSTERVTVLARVHETTFPGYRQLLPERTAATVRVGRVDLRRQLERSSGVLAAKQQTGGMVTVTFCPGGVRVAPRVPEGREHLRMPEMSAQVTGDDALELPIPVRYLIDAVDSFTSDVITLHAQPPGRPSAVTADPDGLTDPQAFIHLVMPVRDPD